MTIHQPIYKKLQECAKQGLQTTYSEIAPLAGLNMDNPADRNRIAQILGDISTYEHEHGRPMLSALVVLAQEGRPGDGFFKLARSLGLYDGHTDMQDLEFFVSESEKVFSYWKV